MTYAGYVVLYAVVGLIAGISLGAGVFFAQRTIVYVERKQRHRILSMSLTIPFWYMLSLALVVLTYTGRFVAENYFGGNGFTTAVLLTLFLCFLHYELLWYISRR